MSQDKLTYSINEVAAVLGVGRTTVYELIREHQLLSIKIGQRRLVARTDLEAFVTDLRARPAA
ncbi:MAG: helix-turn-helix domain-containing protein [Acidimicrobiales bacterium]